MSDVEEDDENNFRDKELEEKFKIKPDLHEYMLTKCKYEKPPRS